MKNIKKVIAIFLVLAMMITMLPASTVMAAKKPGAKISKAKLTLTVGQSYKLNVKNYKKKVKWSSSSKSVATVSSKGKVTAKKAGTATITAKAGKKKLKCKVTVKVKSVKPTTDYQFTMTFDKPVQLTWSTLDAKMNTGRFDNFAGGMTAVFTFEQNNNAGSATPELYLRTGWNDNEIIGSKNFVKDKSKKSITIKYSKAQVDKIKKAKFLYAYGCNIKIKSIKFSGKQTGFSYGYSNSPVAKNGALSVSGGNLVNKNGKKITLQGVCVSGLTWHPDMIRRANFKTLRDEWKVNLIRMAMYVDTSMYGGANDQGYASGTDSDRAVIKDMMYHGIDEATKLGMYAMVDWHILDDRDPNVHIKKAKKFFDEVSKKYAKNDNIIYEICNEPNGGVNWSRIKKYADVIVPIIKANDPDAVIIVGTPSWSSDLTGPVKNPVKGSNIMYAYHFYAATHKDSQRADLAKAVKAGLPVFVTEYGLTEASGEGYIDYESGKKWFSLMTQNNISYCVWNLNSKSDISGSKMSKYFKFIRDYYKKH